MRRFMQNLVFLTAVTALGGCPSDDSSGREGSNGGWATIDHSNIIRRTVEAICLHFVNCSDEWGGTWGSVAECVTFVSEIGTGLGGIDDPALYDIDSDEAQACLEAIWAAPCDADVGTDLEPTCRSAVVGKLAEDDCCDHRGGCGPGLFCDAVDETLTGTCQPLASLGESCAAAVCDDGLYCDSSVCASPKAQGSDCSGFEGECGRLDCIEDATAQTTCQPYLMVGDPCLFDEQCPAAATCIESGGGKTCQPCLECPNTSMTCSTTELSGKCAFSYFFFATHSCSGTMTCEPLPGLAGDCTATDFCSPYLDLYCDVDPDTSRGTCASRLPGGSSCDPNDSDPCRLDSYCCPAGGNCSPSGTCVPEGPLPEECP